ncbi:TetR/AcrR family transcriptional regulator [Streptomyces sp. NPDC046465]|uniref:TetR/AcrR family transcriptional regulator n=1 Tax=Streptomyces sp. NPDC046465 TaxID=3155810 RepID=UPI0033CF2883
MSTTAHGYPTRARLLDAAEHLLRERGLAGATTKAIAADAQCSEAALYKHFTGKVDLLGALLRERLPAAGALLSQPVREEDAEACCVRLVRQLVWFYEQSMPLIGALFADHALLAGLRPLPYGTAAAPDELLEAVVRHLRALRERGGIRAEADVGAAAALLLGVCFQRATLTHVAPEGWPWSTEEFTAAVGRAVAASLAVRPGPARQSRHDTDADHAAHAAPCKELE